MEKPCPKLILKKTRAQDNKKQDNSYEVQLVAKATRIEDNPHPRKLVHFWLADANYHE